MNRNYRGSNNPNWRGGLPNCIDCGKKLSKKTYKRCKSCNNKYLWKLGIWKKQMPEIIKNKISEKLKGKLCHLYKDGRSSKKYYCNCGKKISYPTWLLGKQRCKICAAIGKNNPNYINGISLVTYGRFFTEELKRQIKKIYNNKCQLCNKKGTHVHHIDYNKKNSKKDNLILLCLKCHIKTNYNRDYWYAYFKYYKKGIKE